MLFALGISPQIDFRLGPETGSMCGGRAWVGLSTKTVERMEMQTRDFNTIEFKGVHLNHSSVMGR